MKKLILLILSFTLSSQVFANIPQEYLDRAWKIEKNYLLAVTTGTEGEHTIGKRPYSRTSDSTPTFYINTSKCKSDQCFGFRDRAYNSAVAFANDYNELAGKKVVSVSNESSWGAIPIYLVENLNSFGRWYCGKGVTSGGRKSQCNIRVRVNRNDHAGETVAHEMLNILGIQDTQQSAFKGCLSYDNSRNYTPDYKGLCEVEKKAIIFAYKHLRPGMRKGSVEKAFDKHWKASDFTYALARELEYLANI